MEETGELSSSLYTTLCKVMEAGHLHQEEGTSQIPNLPAPLSWPSQPLQINVCHLLAVLVDNIL